MVKVSILQGDITIFNVYVPNQIKLHEAKTDRTTQRNRLIHYHSWRLQNPSSRNGQIKTISKDIGELNIIIKQVDVIDINRLLHPTNENTHFFPWSHRTFTKIYHILGHKIHPNKFKRLEIMQCLFSDCNGIKLEVSVMER